MGSIVLKRVSKRYGRTEALKGVELTCEAGELTVLLGHSGAGKTSLLRVVAGLETVEEGEVWIDGAVVNDLPPRARGVSMVFESYALYPQATVFNNIAFSLRVSGGGKKVPREEIHRRVREMADLLEIGHLLDRLPRQLSGGQRQRVALGRALVREAAAHLMDEPIAHLDAKLRHQLRATLKHLQKERGMTTVWTTPDQMEAMAIGDRIAVLNRGVIEQVGPPTDLYARPRNEFVARSLGEPPMNFLPAEIRRTGDSWSLRVEGASLPLSSEAAGRLAGGKGDGRVAVGIRPGDIALHPGPVPGGALEGEVLLFELLGQYSVFTVRTREKELKVKTARQADYPAGTRVWLVPDPGRYYFFHPQTGKAVGW